MRCDSEVLAASDERPASFTHLWNLPWPSAAVVGCGLQDLQDEVWKSWRALGQTFRQLHFLWQFMGFYGIFDGS